MPSQAVPARGPLLSVAAVSLGGALLLAAPAHADPLTVVVAPLVDRSGQVAAADLARLTGYLVARLANSDGFRPVAPCDEPGCASRPSSGAISAVVRAAAHGRCRLRITWRRRGRPPRGAIGADTACSFEALQGQIDRAVATLDGHAPRAPAAAPARRRRRATRHRRRQPPHKRPRPAPALRRKAAELAVGFGLRKRTYTTVAPADSPMSPNYDSGLFYSVELGGEVYPATFWRPRSRWSDLGLALSYSRSVGLGTLLLVGDHALATTCEQLLLAARFRWHLLDHAATPILVFGVGYGNLRFAIDYEQLIESPPLPDLDYHFVDLGLDVRWTFPLTGAVALGFAGWLHYLAVIDAGAVEDESAAGYGDARAGGVVAGAGALLRVYGVQLRLEGLYQRMFLSFDGFCALEGRCRAAESATEQHGVFRLTIGYALR